VIRQHGCAADFHSWWMLPVQSWLATTLCCKHQQKHV